MFSQIFSIYSDEERRIDRLLQETMHADPFVKVEQDGVDTSMWKLTDHAAIASIAEAMGRTTVLVADGHHRYETALLYRDAMMLKNPAHHGGEAYNYLPMYFTSLDAPGLIVLPTHRVVHHLPQFDPKSLLTSLAKWFGVERHSSPEALLRELPRATGTAFGLAIGMPSECYLLALQGSSALERSGVPPVLASLDVTVLHTLVMKAMLGMSEEDQAKKRYLDYAKDPQSALQSLREGKAQAVFFMNATPVRQVRSVAEAGFTMPQKSTYFFPKLLSGTVIYSFAAA